jgi:TolA-binding protein
MYDKVVSLAINEDQYAIGEQHFKNGEYIQAIPAYQNFVIANSTDPRALNAQYQIGESYYQMKKYSEAISNFVIVTDKEKTGAIEVRGIAQQKGETDNAIAASKDVSSQLAYRARRSEMNEKKALVLEQIADDRKDITENREKLIPRAIYRQAESYEKLEKNKEALEKYREYIQKYPEGEYIKQAKESIDKLSK